MRGDAVVWAHRLRAAAMALLAAGAVAGCNDTASPPARSDAASNCARSSSTDPEVEPDLPAARVAMTVSESTASGGSVALQGERIDFGIEPTRGTGERQPGRFFTIDLAPVSGDGLSIPGRYRSLEVHFEEGASPAGAVPDDRLGRKLRVAVLRVRPASGDTPGAGRRAAEQVLRAGTLDTRLCALVHDELRGGSIRVRLQPPRGPSLSVPGDYNGRLTLVAVLECMPARADCEVRTATTFHLRLAVPAPEVLSDSVEYTHWCDEQYRCRRGLVCTRNICLREGEGAAAASAAEAARQGRQGPAPGDQAMALGAPRAPALTEIVEAYRHLKGRTYEGAVVFVIDEGFHQGGHGNVVYEMVRRNFRGEIIRVPRRDLESDLDRVERYAGSHPTFRVVVNMSWGAKVYDPTSAALFRRLSMKGVVFVGAAGNDGADFCYYPAGYDGVLAVASLHEGRLASYSNHGDCISLAVNEDIGAASVLAGSGSMVTGTSIAAAQASGIIASLLATSPMYLTGREIRDRLLSRGATTSSSSQLQRAVILKG